MKIVPNGTQVIINENVASWAAGECGVIKHFDGEVYHIAITGDETMQLVFTRNEFRLAKGNKGNREKKQ